MSLNKSKVITYINECLESEKNYYPKAIFEGVKIDVFYQSFGSCGVKIEGQYSETTKEGLYRYKDIDIMVFKWCSNSYYKYLERYHAQHEKEPLKKGFNFLDDLYNHKAKYNCSYYELKSKEKPNIIIMFLGSNEFIISNNYFGVVAVGVRGFDYDTETANYTIKQKGDFVFRSRLAKLCQKYETERLQIKKVNINFIEE